MATMLPNKQQLFDYASNCIQTFIYEIGRPNSILQSDNEPYLKALLQSVANKIGSISVRHSPAYSSQSQGSIERLHRTLFGQVRVLKEQIRQCYNISITMKHPITPWVIKHSAFSSTRTSSTLMDTPATFVDGRVTTRLPSVNLARSSCTWLQEHQNISQSLKTDSSKASGWERTPPVENPT